MTYTMDIETADGVKQHPFHLGTIHSVAERLVLERLADPAVRSIALRQDGQCVAIYDWRAITPDWPERESETRKVVGVLGFDGHDTYE